jgi:hypothetical protein
VALAILACRLSGAESANRGETMVMCVIGR